MSPVFRKFMVTVSSILLGVASGLWLKARFKEFGMWMVPPSEKILTKGPSVRPSTFTSPTTGVSGGRERSWSKMTV